jgi:hypothetical protein
MLYMNDLGSPETMFLKTLIFTTELLSVDVPKIS